MFDIYMSVTNAAEQAENLSLLSLRLKILQI